MFCVNDIFKLTLRFVRRDKYRQKNEKDKYEELFVQAWWFINTLTKEQSPVTKRIVSVKVSLIQHTISEILID